MRHFIDAFLEPALWFAADWSLRWAVVLAVVALLLWIFRPRRAIIRQSILLAALAAGLLVPFAPRWGGGWQRTHQLDEPTTSPSPQRPSRPSFPSSAWERRSGSSASRAAPEPDAKQSFAAVRSQAELGNERETTSEPLGRRRIIVLLLVSGWSFVVLCLLMRRLCGWLFLRRLRRGSVEATGATADLFAACRAELHVRGTVRLAAHPRVRSPVLLGFFRPMILVPPDWPQRTIEAQRASLLHELAHVRRHDHLLAPLLEIVRIAFFFHPLVRWLLRRLEYERELLCDEMVVRQGIDPRDYARLLLEFARTSGRLAWPAVSLPMSRRRTVTGRIHHLLEEDMERWIRPLPARWTLVLGASLLVLTLGVASYRVLAVEKEKAEPPAKKAEKQPAANKSRAPIKREELRYGGKDFYQWRRDLLTELKPSIRADGMKALGTFGAHGYEAEATQAILDMMRGYDMTIEITSSDEDGPILEAAFEAIFKIGRAAVPPLTAAVKDENRNIRYFAIAALRELGRNAKPALPALLQAFKNDDPTTRELAIHSVGLIGYGNKEVVAPLIEALKDNTKDVRRAAASALGAIGESAKPAIPALLKTLSDNEVQVRRTAVRALQGMAGGAKAVQAVSRLLQDKDDEVRKLSYEYLQKLKPEEAKEAVPALIAVLKKEPSEKAIVTLANIGPAAKDAIPELTKLLRSDNHYLRQLAMSALQKISPEDKH